MFEEFNKGKVLIFSAPSGAGKTTVVHHLLQHFDNLSFSVSATSREKRGKEIDGKDYYFFSPQEFKSKIENDEFVEWEEVYHNKYYGTLKSEVERIWKSGKHIVFDVDVEGGINLKKIFGDKALAIFIKAPDIQHLERRLQARLTESEESIKERVAKATIELEKAPQFDIILLNDKLKDTFEKAEKIVSEFIQQN